LPSLRSADEDDQVHQCLGGKGHAKGGTPSDGLAADIQQKFEENNKAGLQTGWWEEVLIGDCGVPQDSKCPAEISSKGPCILEAGALKLDIPNAERR